MKEQRTWQERWPSEVVLKRAEWSKEESREIEFPWDEKQSALMAGDYHRLILNCTRQWGKSTVTAAKAVERATSRAGSLVLVVSPSERQSAEFVRKAAEFVRMAGVRARGDGSNDVSLLLPNGSRIVGVPGREATVRGFSAVSLLIIDEASRVSDEQYRAVLPMLAVGDGDLWLMSTPWGKRGFFWEVWSKGGAEWKKESVQAAECGRIGAAFLEEQRESMGDMWYRQEFCCEFVDVESSLFDRDMLEAAIKTGVRALWT